MTVVTAMTFYIDFNDSLEYDLLLVKILSATLNPIYACAKIWHFHFFH